ncbi:MAG: DUF11 domain-containing protein [Clostridia bacterium]|nr:DUF11 domain-containing protein [Clostridia bacterium]
MGTKGFQTRKDNIAKKLVAILLIIALTMVDFIFIGVEAVSYAADSLTTGTATNNKNVTFDCYFKGVNGEAITEKTEAINNNSIKLYGQVSVKNDGYFVGSVTLGESNFKLKNEILSDSINKIEGNTITLNQVNAGEVVEFEIGIDPIKNDTINSGFLNMLSDVSINGIYRNNKEKDIEIKATRNVQLTLSNPYAENEGVEFSTNIITNKVYNVNGENKRIVQVLVESGLVGSQYPIKETNIELNVPNQVEKVDVISRGTFLTNGKNETEFNSNDWNYSKEEQKIEIAIKNLESNKTIKWTKNEKDQLIVTYIMDANTNINNTNINAKTRIILYDVNSTVKESTSAATISEEKDGIITSEIKPGESNIYKGKIYSGEDRIYNLTTNIYVNEAETGKNANIELLPTTYETSEGELSANIQLSNTIINKSQVLRVLGEDGTLRILSSTGSYIAEINNATQTDENGNVLVKYPEGTTSVKVETSNAKNTGTISLSNMKVIKQDGNSREIKAKYVAIKEKISGSESKIELHETSEDALLQVSKSNLSTLVENTGVEITTILKTSNEQNELYKNPTIKIALPSQVENVTVNGINLLYEDELKISSANTHDENGAKVIEINLEGEQTKHKAGNVQETTIIINANLTLNKKATNSNETISMTCVNGNTGAQIEKKQPIEVVSPRGMVTVNSINDYGMTVIGEDNQTSKLELGTGAKQTQVNIEVINNNEEKVNGVKVMGNFPTKNETNTIETSVSGIEVSGMDAKVYYTENENATDNLEDNTNGWNTEITDNSKVKKYMIALDSMEQSQGISASYGLNIPAGLQYNEQTYEGYKVTYNNANTANEVVAATLGLSTGKGPELTTTMKVKNGNNELANGQKVAQGEVVKYEITAENTGTEEATNVVISGTVPEGTVYVEPKENYVYEAGYYNEIQDKKEVIFEVESIPAGEKVTKSYEVKVTKNAQIGEEIENKATIKYGEATAESETVKYIVSEGGLSVTVNRASDLKIDTYAGGSLAYFVGVENISNETKKNVIVNLNLPNEYELLSTTVSINDEDIIGDSKTVELGDLNSGEIKYIYVVVKIKSLDNTDSKQIGISATVKAKNTDEVKSNEYMETVKDYKLNISLSSNHEDGYIKTGDIVEYTIKIENTTNVDSTYVDIADVIPGQLTVQSVTVNGEEEPNENNFVLFSRKIKANSAIEAKVNAVVNYSELRTEPEIISNVATIGATTPAMATSEEITHIIQADSQESGDIPGENPNSGGNGGNNGQKTDTGLISGTAWLDENQNGQRDNEEKLLEGIRVDLVDKNGNIVKNAEGNDIVATTNNKGVYILSNVPKGDYLVVFEYDTSTYITTAYQKSGVSNNRNSDVITKKLSINGQEKNCGVTDTVSLNNSNISNLDLGLMNATKFDLELNKYISKIVVQTKKETKTYNYDKATLAKAEIAAKQLQGANVIIEYQIEVKNAGEVAGYVKNIVDYAPSSLKFSSELNKDWYQSGNNLFNTSLTNTKLEAGETKTVTLTLTKTMTEENTGLVNNKAEIAESYNEAGIKDLDSTAGNKTQGEDDMGSADVIIGVKTGAMITYISLILLVITMIGVTAYFINKKFDKDTHIEVNF